MTDTKIIPYTFDMAGAATPVRIVMRGGEPWFVAADVTRALGYTRVPHALRMLDDDEKGVHKVDTLGGEQNHAVVSESGLYALILRSRRPTARAFRRWVTGEVLPSIRRTGRYAPPLKLGTAVEPFLHDHQLRVLAAVRAIASDEDTVDVPPIRLAAIVGLSVENVNRTIRALAAMGFITLVSRAAAR